MAKSRLLTVFNRIEKEFDDMVTNVVKKDKIPYNVGLFTLPFIVVREYLYKAGCKEELVEEGIRAAIICQSFAYCGDQTHMLTDDMIKADVLKAANECEVFDNFLKAMMHGSTQGPGAKYIDNLSLNFNIKSDKLAKLVSEFFPGIRTPEEKTMFVGATNIMTHRNLFNLLGRFVGTNDIMRLIRQCNAFGCDQELGVELLDKLESRWKKHELASYFYDLERQGGDERKAAFVVKTAFLVREVELLLYNIMDRVMIEAMFTNKHCQEVFCEVAQEEHVKSMKNKKKIMEDAEYNESRGGGLNYAPTSVSTSTVNSSNYKEENGWSVWEVLACIGVCVGVAYVGRVAYNYATNSSFGVMDAVEFTNEEILSFVGLGHNEFV